MKSSMKKLLKLAQHAPPYLSSVVSSVKLCSYYRKDFQQNLIVIQSHLCPPFSVLGNPIDFLFFCHLIIDLVFCSSFCHRSGHQFGSFVAISVIIFDIILYVNILCFFDSY